MPKLDLSPASVLITGGSAGIGLGLARRFLEGGARVLITGRTPLTLVEAAKAYPGLLTFVSDIGEADQRAALAQHLRETLPRLNMVVNNAGVQRRVALAEDVSPWSERQREIDILFGGPVHLNSLLVPTLLGNDRDSLIVNVTSGGAYIISPSRSPPSTVLRKPPCIVTRSIFVLPWRKQGCELSNLSRRPSTPVSRATVAHMERQSTLFAMRSFRRSSRARPI